MCKQMSIAQLYLQGPLVLVGGTCTHLVTCINVTVDSTSTENDSISFGTSYISVLSEYSSTVQMIVARMHVEQPSIGPHGCHLMPLHVLAISKDSQTETESRETKVSFKRVVGRKGLIWLIRESDAPIPSVPSSKCLIQT